MNKNHLYMHL